MILGAELENIRGQCKMPLYVAYLIFETNEIGYHQIVTGRQKPTILQLILFIDTTHVPIMSIMNKVI